MVKPCHDTHFYVELQVSLNICTKMKAFCDAVTSGSALSNPVSCSNLGHFNASKNRACSDNVMTSSQDDALNMAKACGKNGVDRLF